jgi:hypothetical protein
MYDKQRHGFCSEFYTVEKTIEVVVTIAGESETIRIDAIKEGNTGKYSTRACRIEHLTVQPTYPQSGGSFDCVPQDYRVWVDYDLPWTDRDSADAALNQALGFLKDRCSE